MKNYWLHRISYCSYASYPLLLKENCLTIGFSDILKTDPDIASKLQNNTIDKDTYDKTVKDTYGELLKNKWYLWYFLKEISRGDIIIVPSWGKFAIYEVEESARSIRELSLDNFEGWNNLKLTITKDRGLIAKKEDNSEEEVDLGFYLKVKALTNYNNSPFAPRDKFLTNNLLRRLKFHGTTTTLNDLLDEVESTISNVNNGKTLDFYKVILEETLSSLQKNINKYTNDRGLEKLVRWYFEKIGAEAEILPKNNSKAKGIADADVVAYFNNLGIMISVQVKQHEGLTDEHAVEQIKEYLSQNSTSPNSNKFFTSIGWVISTSDNFSERAKISAQKDTHIRLINGREFSKMLLDAGLSNINDAF